jgi:hypothetical protein
MTPADLLLIATLFFLGVTVANIIGWPKVKRAIGRGGGEFRCRFRRAMKSGTCPLA